MPSALVDTSVLVDVIRQFSAARAWFDTTNNLGYSELVWFELVQGASSRRELAASYRVLRHLQQVELNRADFAWARAHLPDLSLSHNVGAFDCLIAAGAARLNLPLYTTNLKHFAPLLGTLAVKPY